MTDDIDINEKLDSIILDFFSTLDDLYKSQSTLNENMKGGFLQMSRARYSMGVKSVGMSQCDENKMRAHMKIYINEENNERSSDDNIFVLNKINPIQTEEMNKEMDKVVETIGLRKRNVKKDATLEGENDRNLTSDKDLSIEDTSTRHTNSSTSQGKINANLDPLKWFGVLVPSSLRQSQTHFKNAIEQTVIVANLKHKLCKLQQQYVDCLAQKMQNAKLNTE